MSYMNDKIVSEIRANIMARFECDYPPIDRADFDLERKVRTLVEVLNYLGVQMPEAYEAIGEVRDLLMRQRHAEALTPMLKQFI